MLTLPGAFYAVPNSDSLAVAIRDSVPFPNTFVCVVLEMGHAKSSKKDMIVIVRWEWLILLADSAICRLS